MSASALSQIGCALIGPGNFGRILARALQEDARVRFAGVLGATHAESAATAAELGGRAYASLDELLRDDAAQAVLISPVWISPTRSSSACASRTAASRP